MKSSIAFTIYKIVANHLTSYEISLSKGEKNLTEESDKCLEEILKALRDYEYDWKKEPYEKL